MMLTTAGVLVRHLLRKSGVPRHARSLGGCAGRAYRACRHRWTAGPAALLVVAVTGGLAGAAPAVPAVPAVPAGPAGIVAGRAIGPARLGMSESDAAAALGPSTSVSPSRRAYPRVGLVVDFDRGVAVRIATSSPKYRTAAGAGVGTVAQDTARLIGDINSVTTVSGADTTVLYMFQGIGFVYRGGRATEAFVVAPVAIGPRPPAAGAPAPAAPSGPAAAPSGPAAASALVRDVKANVLSVGGLSVTGTLVNTGNAPAGPFTVTGLFTKASGDQVEAKTTIQGPLAPGGGAPFMLQAAMVADIIIRYQVSVASSTGTLLATEGPDNVPASAYQEFAMKQIHVKVDLGAPSNKIGPPTIQALVSVVDTGAIPAQWVQQITVQVPYTAAGASGTQTTQLRPGQTQVVLVPAGATLGAPAVTGVLLVGG